MVISRQTLGILALAPGAMAAVDEFNSPAQLNISGRDVLAAALEIPIPEAP